ARARRGAPAVRGAAAGRAGGGRGGGGARDDGGSPWGDRGLVVRGAGVLRDRQRGGVAAAVSREPGAAVRRRGGGRGVRGAGVQPAVAVGGGGVRGVGARGAGLRRAAADCPALNRFRDTRGPFAREIRRKLVVRLPGVWCSRVITPRIPVPLWTPEGR